MDVVEARNICHCQEPTPDCPVRKQSFYWLTTQVVPSSVYRYADDVQVHMSVPLLDNLHEVI